MLFASILAWGIGIILVLMLSGCATISPRKGQCVAISHATARRMVRQGLEVRLGHGWFRGTPHCWVEYKKGEKWLIRDDSIWYVGRGFTFEEHGDYKLKYYQNTDWMKGERL